MTEVFVVGGAAILFALSLIARSLWDRATNPPCQHEYETIATLKDRPRNALAATIVQVCKTCGKTREQTFKAPEVGCDHKWKKIDSASIRRGNEANVEKRRVVGYLHTLQCERCGEIQSREVVMKNA